MNQNHDGPKESMPLPMPVTRAAAAAAFLFCDFLDEACSGGNMSADRLTAVLAEMLTLTSPVAGSDADPEGWQAQIIELPGGEGRVIELQDKIQTTHLSLHLDCQGRLFFGNCLRRDGDVVRSFMTFSFAGDAQQSRFIVEDGAHRHEIEFTGNPSSLSWRPSKQPARIDDEDARIWDEPKWSAEALQGLIATSDSWMEEFEREAAAPLPFKPSSAQSIAAAPILKPTPATPTFCRHCGHRLAPASKFCGRCGQPVEGRQPGA
jgi:hypothetical protein